jgi:hypothetical protein
MECIKSPEVMKSDRLHQRNTQTLQIRVKATVSKEITVTMLQWYMFGYV